MSLITNFIKSLSSDENPTTITFDTIKNALELKGLQVKCWKDLFIVTYKKSDANNDENEIDPLVKECRGIILNKNSPFNVVCKGFDMFEKKLPEKITEKNYKITQTIDGTYVRLYYYGGKWCVATNRCIDAKRARWQSYKTFNDYFQEASQIALLDKSKLSTSNTYLFVVCHPENRIVTIHKNIDLYHIGTIDNNNFKEIDEDIGIKKPAIIVTEPSETVELDWQNPGYVIEWTDDNVTKRYKIENPKYEYVNQLRGNTLNVTEHYLNLRSDKPQQFMEFCKYFPEYSVIEDSLNMVARYIQQLYINYYVMKTIEYVPDRISWRILNELHRRYIRTKEPTSLDIVQNYIRSMPNAELAQLLRF